MTGIIYLWTNRNTGKHYVGQTINPDLRKASHICEAFTRGSDYYFHRSLRKHGLDAFTYSVLEENIERCNLNNKENFYIEKYNSLWPNGYNQCLANSLGETAIKKMSETKKRQWLELNDDEKAKRLEKLRQANLGKKQTPKQKQRAAEANQKEWIITHPDGKVETVINLRKFCIDKGLGTNGQSNLVRGSYKGYRAVKA